MASPARLVRCQRNFPSLRRSETDAMKFLPRYLDEKEPTLENFAKVVRELDQRRLDE